MLNKIDLFRMRHSNGTYEFNFVDGTWGRAWPLELLSAMLADFPAYRGYLNGTAKPSVAVSR